MKLRLFIACCPWWLWVLAVASVLVAGVWVATSTTVARFSNGKTWAVFAGQGRVGLETFDAQNGTATFIMPSGFSRGTVGLAPPSGSAPASTVRAWVVESLFWREAPKDRSTPGLMRRGIPIALIAGLLAAGVLWGVWKARGRFRATMAGRCSGCGYDLAGLGARAPCPECGRAR